MKTIAQILILGIVIIVGILPCKCAGVRYCDYTNLGQSIDTICINLTSESPDDVSPILIDLNADKGILNSIVAKYPKSVTLEEVRSSVNKKWSAFENKKLANSKL